MSIAVITAADGARWEADLVGRLSRSSVGLDVSRRCVDVVELVAVAAAGLGAVAFVDAQLRRLDREIVERLTLAGVATVGVIEQATDADIELLREVGIGFAIPASAPVEVFLDVAQTALATLRGDEPESAADLAFADPSASSLGVPTQAPDESGAVGADLAEPLTQPGLVIGVWGPTGAPGRTTVAINLADELSRLGASALLIDMDVYGGVIANSLGLMDESPGVVAACRQASTGRLDLAGLFGLCWQFNPRLRVLTGTLRADRWPELRPSGVESVIAYGRCLAEMVVIDLGFSLEADEELSFDTVAPRRNGATLAALEAADVILAVGSADPVGLQRLVQGLDELRRAEIDKPTWIILNRTRESVLAGKAESELDAALTRFAGRGAAAFLPYDRDALDESMRLGRTLAEAAPTSPLRKAMVELAAALSGRDVPATGRRRLRPSGAGARIRRPRRSA